MKDYATAAHVLDTAEDAWTSARIEVAMRAFHAEHTTVRTDTAARAPSNLIITPTDHGTWNVVQVLSDPEEANDWKLSFSIDLARSAEAGRPVLRVVDIGV